MIKTPQTPTFPKDWNDKDDLVSYIRELRRALETVLQHVYQDFFNGNSQFKVVTEVPVIADIDEGEFLLLVTGDTFKIYTNVNDELKTLG